MTNCYNSWGFCKRARLKKGNGMPIGSPPTNSKKEKATSMSLLMLFLLIFLSLGNLVSAQTTVTITCTGAAASFQSGSVNATGTKNDGNMITINSSSNRGWAHFNLTTIPANAIVSAVTANFTTYTSVSSGATNNLYGFSGDPSSITGATLYTNCASGASLFAGTWTANALNAKVLNATGIAFIQAQVNANNANIGYVRASTNTYNIAGYPGVSGAAPSLTITYATPCTGTPNNGAIASTAGICSGATAGISIVASSLTAGQGISYQWEESDDNGATDAWANAVGGSGATSGSYTSPVLSNVIFYRIKTTCSNSSLSASSNACAVSVLSCDYNVTRTSDITYNSIGTSGTGLTGFTSLDDSSSSATNIGFDFFYKGTTFTQFVANTNGFLGLGASTSSSYTNNLGSGTNIIAPYWDDLYVTGGGSTASISNFIKYQLDGVAPNRVLTVEWIGMEQYQNAGPNINFQVKLYETTNRIEIVHGQMQTFDGSSSTGSAYSYSVGIAGPSTATGTIRTLALLGENSNAFSSTDATTLTLPPLCNVSYSFAVAPAYTGATTFTYVAPSNDDAAGAISLPVNTTPCSNLCGTYYSSKFATASSGVVVCSAATAGTPDDDVWFKFVAASSSHKIQVFGGTGSSGYDPVVQLFSDTGATSLFCANATGPSLTETINATGLIAGNTYYVRIYHAGIDSGTSPSFSICISDSLIKPVNDDPCGAVSLTSGVLYNDTSTTSTTNVVSATTTAINGVTTPACTSAGTSVNDVWFKFTSTSISHGITVTPVSGFDVALEGYVVSSGTCGGNNLVLTSIGCVNGAGSGAVEQVVLTTTVGQVLYFRVYRHPSGISGAPISNSQFSVNVFNPTPVCTTNTAPAAAATNVSLLPTLTWAAANYATSYDVYMGTSSGSETLLANTATATYTLTALQTLAQGVQYFWYVVPKNTNGTPACGVANETSFTTLNCSPTTSVTVSNITFTTAQINWAAASPAPSNGYAWEIRSSGAGGSGATGLVANGTTAAGILTATSSALTANNVYIAYVMSDCGSGISTWVAAAAFTTGYCTPGTSTIDPNDGILNVVLNNVTQNTTLTQASGFTQAFTSYANTPLSVMQGNTMSVAITMGSNASQYSAVWIDYNNDLTFSPSENVGLATVSAGASGTKTYTFSIPITAAVGQTTVRIRGGSDSAYTTADACSTISYGETEDYQINIVAAPVCSGTPTAGAILPATQTACNGFAPSSAFTASGYTAALGITFQWEFSLNGTTGWSNVSTGTGATTDSYTPSASGSTIYFRAAVTCSGNTSYTAAVSLLSVNCTYNTSLSSASYSSIMPANGGSGSAFAGWINTSGDDNTSATTSLAGTTFTYQGATVTGFQACSNGWMTFNTANTSVQYSNDLGSSGQSLVLAPFWDDLVFTGQDYANRNNSLRYQVSGTLGSGSAVITVEWAGIEKYNIPGPNLNFQVKLYESNNNIEFVYGNFEGFDGTFASDYSYSTGYNGATPAGTTSKDRFALQTPNANYFSSISDPATHIIMPDCNTKITFTSGTYSGLTVAPSVVAPSNDEAVGAISLGVTVSPPTALCGTFYNSRGATNSGAGQACATTAGNQDDDVWFTFTTGSLTDYSIRLKSSPIYNGVLQLLDATLTPIICVNATGVGATEVINATGLATSTTYYLRVFHDGTGSTASGQFAISVNEVIAPPTNDNISGATTLAVNATCTTTNSQLPFTTSATASPTTPLSTIGNADDDVWYSFVATTAIQTITVQSGSGYNAAFQVLSSSDNMATGTLTALVNQNNTSTGGVETYTNSALVPGNTYFVRVFHFASGAGTGNFTICITAPSPVCTTNSSPANLAAGINQSIAFSWASAAIATSYDLYLGTASGAETLLANSSTTSYSLTAGQALQFATTYFWYVVPKNSNGSASCGVANETRFTTLCPTPITSAQTFCTGATVGNLVATGNSLKWYDAGTAGNLLLSSASLITGTYYATQTINSIESARIAVNITIDALSAAGILSGNGPICSGFTATVTLASKTGTIQWQKSANGSTGWIDINGTTLSSINTGVLIATTYYRAVVTNGECSSSTSNTATITVNQPSDGGTATGATTICSGNATIVNLSDNLGSIQWQNRISGSSVWNDISGATSASFNTGALTVTTNFRAIVTNGVCSEAYSNLITITVSEASDAGTALGTTSVCSGSAASVSLTGSSGTIQWQISANGSTGWTNIGGATSSFLNTGNLTATTYYRALVTNGVCSFATSNIVTVTVITTPAPTAYSQTLPLTSTVANLVATGSGLKWYTTSTGGSALIASTFLVQGTYYVSQTLNGCEGTSRAASMVTLFGIPTTKINTAQCGTTIATIDANISANIITGAEMYRFQVTNGGTSNVFEVNKYNFNLTQTPGILYGTTYGVRVAVQMGGIWGAYGVSCNITTPSIVTVSAVPTPKIRPSQCGSTLATLGSPIHSTLITAATSYRFEVTNGATVRTFDSPIYYFNLTDIVGSAYGTTYSIRVAVNVAGIMGNFGLSCSLTTPALTTGSVPVTKIDAAFCGATLATLATKISASTVYGAEGYRFRIIKSGVTTIYDSSFYNFRLSDAGVVVTNSSTYAISVAAKINGIYGNYGASCNVTTPGSSGSSRQIVETTDFNLVAFPNPSKDAFKLQVSGRSDETISVLVFDMLGKQIENRVINSSDVENISLGQNYSSGIYNVIVSQGTNTKSVRLIKN